MTSVPIPKTMKAIQIPHFGGPEVLHYKSDIPTPTPQRGEILVKNDFIGINYVDIYWRIGMMGLPPNGILGREAEGKVVALGPGSDSELNIGDRVVWYAEGGGYAEYTAIPAGRACIVPPQISPGMAAASMMQGLTALTLTQRVYPVKPGEWALAHAAAGGVGGWLCQVLKSKGARVIGTAGSEEKCKLAKEYGADGVINYREQQGEDFLKRVQEITGGEGVNVIFDAVGKDQTENDVRVVKKGGTIVLFGVSSGMPFPVSPAVFSAKNIRFIGPGESALMRSVGTPGEFAYWCGKLFEALTREKDKVKVRIHGTYPLEEVGKAHRDLEGRQTTGKLLVKP